MKVVGSSSAGNSYVLSCGGETLLIELGVKWDNILKGLDFNIDNVVGAIVSHAHKDHSKSIPDALSCGIKVYSNPDVAEKYKGVTPLSPFYGYKIGAYKVFALPVQHDAPCYAYVIRHKDMGKLLFVTDTMMLGYRINGLNHIMIEANYSDDIVERNVEKGLVPPYMKERLMTTHFSIQNVVAMLKTNDLSAVNDITLLHLSGLDADRERFRSEVERGTGKAVYVAEKGLEISVGKEVY